MEVPVRYNWETKQILVVEDDESSSFLLGTILGETGARVAFSRDGAEAVNYMRTHPGTDLILMDIQLPEMDGLTASRTIKAFARDVVIIAQTAFAFTVDPDQAMKAGCDGFLTKPLNPTELLEKLSYYLV